MSEITPAQLLDQLQEQVRLLTLGADQQDEWAAAERVPAEELALQLYDSVPTWFARLREHHLIDAQDEGLLEELVRQLIANQTSLFPAGTRTNAQAAAWPTVRALASRTLESLRRPPWAKH